MHPILLPKGARIGLRYLRKRGYGKSKAPGELSATGSYPAKLQIKVSSDAIGTIIADRPPHRTVRALLRIRLPPWMSGEKASCRIGMQHLFQCVRIQVNRTTSLRDSPNRVRRERAGNRLRQLCQLFRCSLARL